MLQKSLSIHGIGLTDPEWIIDAIALFEFCDDRKIESGASKLKLDLLCGHPLTNRKDKIVLRGDWKRPGKGPNSGGKLGRNRVVANIAMKLNIHRFQKKSKQAWKNVGLFGTFFVPVHVAHFKSYDGCNRLSVYSKLFLQFMRPFLV